MINRNLTVEDLSPDITVCHETEQLLSQRGLELADLIINCLLINVIGLLGIIGNITNVLVLSQFELNTSTNILLLSLSLTDLAYVITTCLRRSPCMISLFDEATAKSMEAVQSAYFLLLNTLLGNLSSGHIVFMSVERFLAVYFPLKVGVWLTPRVTMITLGIMCVFWMLLLGPLFLPLFAIQWVFDPTFNKSIGLVTYTQYSYDNWDKLSMLNIVGSYIEGPLQCLIIAVCSLCTVTKLAEMSKKRKKLSTASRDHNDERVAKMLLVVCLAFLITGVPTFIPPILYMARPDLMQSSGDESRFGMLMEMMNDLLNVINSSINFIIYVRMSKKFYNTCTKLTCRNFGDALLVKN